MRIRCLAHLFFISLSLTVMVAAQEPVEPRLTPRIITATKQVTLFTGLEKQLLQAVQKKDKAGLQAMVTEDLEIDMPDADPLEGDDWLDSVLAPDFTLKSFIIRQMSVNDLGDFALVKFDRIQQATLKGKSLSGEFYVVDLWKKVGDSWKLSSRYVSKIAGAPAPAPHEPKPTGKE